MLISFLDGQLTIEKFKNGSLDGTQNGEIAFYNMKIDYFPEEAFRLFLNNKNNSIYLSSSYGIDCLDSEIVG